MFSQSWRDSAADVLLLLLLTKGKEDFLYVIQPTCTRWLDWEWIKVDQEKTAHVSADHAISTTT